MGIFFGDYFTPNNRESAEGRVRIKRFQRLAAPFPSHSPRASAPVRSRCSGCVDTFQSCEAGRICTAAKREDKISLQPSCHREAPSPVSWRLQPSYPTACRDRRCVLAAQRRCGKSQTAAGMSSSISSGTDTRPSDAGHGLKALALIRSILRMPLERTCNRPSASINSVSRGPCPKMCYVKNVPLAR
jgi:hypothetical protein